MDTATVVMAAIALVLLVLAYLRGSNVFVAGIKAGAQMLWNVLLLLLLSFLVAGLVQVLIPKEQIRRWMGTESGLRGILLGCLAGGLVPGPPYVVFPIVASLYRAGAGAGAVVGFQRLVALVGQPLPHRACYPRPASCLHSLSLHSNLPAHCGLVRPIYSCQADLTVHL